MQVLWFTLADWLESELSAVEAAGEVAFFLTRQFLEFLGARKMRLAQVEKFMPEGVRALSNMLDMLFEAAAACQVSGKIAAGRDYAGVYLDGSKYWLGVLYTDPESLWFSTRRKINPEAAAKLGVGELTEESWVPGGYRWWRGVELNSEPVHFF